MRWPSERRCAAVQRAETSRGFTLIELLVVLAVMALLLLAVPQATAGLPGFRLHAAASSLADTLRQLRDDAIRTGQTTALQLDAAHVRYRVPGNAGWQSFPAIVEAVSLSRDSPVRAEPADMVRFFADGSASGGVFTLRHGSRSATVSVAWLTGRVRGD